jgi:hypothetical protein
MHQVIFIMNNHYFLQAAPFPVASYSDDDIAYAWLSPLPAALFRHSRTTISNNRMEKEVL